MSVTVASTRRWFNDNLAKAFVTAFLYEYLTKDDDNENFTKLNNFINSYTTLFPNDPVLTGELPDGSRAPMQINRAKMPQLRKDIKGKLGLSHGVATEKAFLDDQAYSILLQACREMVTTKLGKGHFYNLIYHADEIVFEEADADLVDNKDTKGWITGAPSNQVQNDWKMTNVGDPGLTNMQKVDWALFVSLASATGVLSKGALDKSIEAGVVKPGDQQDYDKFFAKVDRLFTGKLDENNAAWQTIQLMSRVTHSGHGSGEPASVDQTRHIAIQYPLDTTFITGDEGKLELPKVVKTADSSTFKGGGIPWVLTEDAIELVDFSVVTGKFREETDDRLVYYPEGFPAEGTEAGETRTIAGSELGDTQELGPTGGMVRLVKEGFTYDGKSTVKVDRDENTTAPSKMIMAGLGNYPPGAEGDNAPQRIMASFSNTPDNLKAHMASVITNGASWDTADGKSYKWQAQPIRQFKTTLLDYLKTQMVPPQNLSNLNPQHFPGLSAVYAGKPNPAKDRTWRGDQTFEIAFYSEASTGPHPGVTVQAEGDSPNSPSGPTNLRGRVLTTSFQRGVALRGALKWKPMVEETDNGPWAKNYQKTSAATSGTTFRPSLFKNNLFGNNALYLAYNPGYEGDGADSGLAAVSAYTSRIIARIARCYPGLLNRTLIEVIKELLIESKEKNTRNKTKSTVKPVPRPPVDVTGLKPYDLQCFLIQNIRTLTYAKDTEIQERIKEGRGAYENLSIIVDKKNSQVMENPFTGPQAAPARGVQPGNMISYINHGGSEQTPKVSALLNLCPDAYALLTPYIKVCRVDYRDEDTLVPFREVEIPFPTFIDPKDIEQITNGALGRYSGAGIKSFTWKLDGVNPAEVENNISAELQLRFQTLQDLFSLNQSLSAGGEEAGYLDLIIGSGTSFRKTPKESPGAQPRSSPGCQDLIGETYEGSRFRIKATVGWATPPGFSNMEFRGFQNKIEGTSQTHGEFLEKAIDDTRVSLYLQVVGHDLSFQEDGAVDLKVRYQASLDGILKAPNADIFVGGTEFDEKLKEMKDALKASDAADAEYIESNGDKTKEIDRLQKKREKKLEDMIDLTTKNKSFKYKRFLCNLYDKSQIYMLRVDVDALKKAEDMTPEQRAEMANSRLDPNGNYTNMALTPQRASETDVESLILGAQTAIGKAVAGKEQNPGSARAVNRNIIRSIKKGRGGTKYASTKYLDVPYFYLGDLIDGILSYLKNIVDSGNGFDGSFQMMLSNIEILDPMLAFKYPDVSIQCGDGEGPIIQRALADIDPLRFKNSHMLAFFTNIGSLPISLEYFQEWFVNNVVRPQRETFSFINFIKQICANLIGRSFNSKCFGDALNFNLRFDTANFGLDESFTSKIVSPEEVARSKAKASQKGMTLLDQDLGDAPVIPSLVLYSADSRPSVSKSEMENIQNGIYTHYIGGACGLSKKISFHKNDMPYFREARLQREGTLSALQLRELYNVQIDMIGNNLHRNGQYIKVDPTSIGVGAIDSGGSLSNLAQLLGIGGYYLVSSVTHSISSDGFDVRVVGLQEGITLSAGTLVAIHQFEGDGKESPKSDPS